MSNEIDSIVNGDIDLYQFLEVEPTFEANEIKRQYRRKALQYHPDKNPSEDAAKKFHLLSQVYEILTNDNLRSNYDSIRQLKINKLVRLKKLSEQTRAFKEELEKAEREHKFNNLNVFDNTSKEFVNRKVWENKLEKLKEDGLQKRRLHEKRIIERSVPVAGQVKKYKSFDALPLEFGVISTISNTNDNADTSVDNNIKQTKKTLVKWKRKTELQELFTPDVLQEIMKIFGSVRSTQILPNSSNLRYDTGIVEFENFESAHRAVNHDYKKSATIWDGTKVRKLASLLRECKYDSPIDNTDNNDDTVSPVDASKIKKLIAKPNQLAKFNPPSKYAVRNVTLKSDTYMDQIINSFIRKEANELL